MRGLHKALHIAGVDTGSDCARHASTSLASCYCANKQARAAREAAERAAERPQRRTRGVTLQQACPPLSLAQQASKSVGEYVLAGFALPSRAGQMRIASGVTFEHLEFTQFNDFRHSLGVSDEAYFRSLSRLHGGITQDSGKSGSVFWFSEDGKFIVKSATELEVSSLLDMMPRYTAHVVGSEMVGLPCLLSRYLGAYQLLESGVSLWFVVMNNIFAGQVPQRIYDLKGTTEDRFVKPGRGKVLKDTNFEHRRIRLAMDDAKAVLQAVDRDSSFLRAERVMDYSLLLGLSADRENVDGEISGAGWSLHLLGDELVDMEDDEEEDEQEEVHAVHCQVGIIDTLARWTAIKIAAHILKKPTIGCCHEIDTEPPQYYQNRFMEYVESKFLD